MELDSRILEGKRPLDCLDIDIAKTYIGKKGYFANCIQAFQDLESTDYQLVYATLKEVDSRRVIAFTDDFDGEHFYFLPEEWVKSEKKYRALTNTEFVDLFDLGKFRSIRLKDNSTKRLERLIITDIYVQGDYLYAKLNSSDTGYGPAYFFSKCEYFDGKDWQPFGIEVEE